MKEAITQISIAFIVGLLGVFGLIFWIRAASEDYANKHPELTKQAQQSVEEYNQQVDEMNARAGAGSQKKP